MIELIPGLPDDIVAVSAKGIVTADDYEKILIPAVEEKLKRHARIRLLYHFGRDFDKFTAAAMWDDAKIGLKHLTAFDKIAVVSDVGWIVEAVKIFGFIIPYPVRIFANDKLSEAKSWLSQ